MLAHSFSVSVAPPSVGGTVEIKPKRFSTLTSRATHAHPTSPRSTGFCAVWDCISSSSSSFLCNEAQVAWVGVRTATGD